MLEIKDECLQLSFNNILEVCGNLLFLCWQILLIYTTTVKCFRLLKDTMNSLLMRECISDRIKKNVVSCVSKIGVNTNLAEEGP